VLQGRDSLILIYKQAWDEQIHPARDLTGSLSIGNVIHVRNTVLLSVTLTTDVLIS
jgi:hypothetical protein